MAAFRRIWKLTVPHGLVRVYAQVAPAYRAQADRIFSWYLDVLNADPTVATADDDGLARSGSDNDPDLSSGGVYQEEPRDSPRFYKVHAQQ